MVRVNRKVGRTTDGRLVEFTDPEAAFLAYVPGDEVPNAEAKRVGLVRFLEKMTDPPADKMQRTPANKGLKPKETP